MHDPFAAGDPTNVLGWLVEKGRLSVGQVKLPPDVPVRMCANPACDTHLEGRLPSTMYCERSCKEAHVTAKRHAARDLPAQE